ncbi:MAG: hypothetical protein LBU65_10475 [Planctomycetaceae bacterium]|jgi:hypothetical protein|nr:hypothetical protein [Planctomycetaceae bacterium]
MIPTEQTSLLDEISKGKNSIAFAELKKLLKPHLKQLGLAAKPKDADILAAIQPLFGSDYAVVKRGTENTPKFFLIRKLSQEAKETLVQESILKEVAKSKTDSYFPAKTFGNDLPMSQDDIVSILDGFIKSNGNECLQVVLKNKKNVFVRRLSQSEKEALVLESIRKKTKPTIGFSPTKTFISEFPAIVPEEVIAIFNRFLQAGRLMVSVDKAFKFVVQLAENSGSMISAITSPSKSDRELFRAAFDKLNRRRTFVRICDLRKELIWSKERFDTVLTDLRYSNKIQLHPGSPSDLTTDEIADSYIDDEKRFYITVTWIQ